MSMPGRSDPETPDSFPDTCPLCGGPVDPTDPAARCDACGLHLAGTPGRPSPFRSGALWSMVGVLVLGYALTLGIVLATK